ncbi:hypothetical protein [Streptomyces zinciresistens]|uniref:hypothetical protein n=1 Tax=Streptomyces zinciresistens TaxID=1073330 RepID=UPI0011119829|nr:hypothetical protein [Streptomyces zinciresistens]
MPERSLPCILLPVVRFLAEAKEGRGATLVLNGKEIGPPMDLPASTQNVQESLRLLRVLDDIQRISGVYFPIHQSLTDSAGRTPRQS